jgi:hypothetical protein
MNPTSKEQDEIKRILIQQKSVVFVELLEAPWWVINEHIKDNPDSPISSLIKKSMCTSVMTTQKEVDLRYWVSSASMMRGVDESKHKLRFINQTDEYKYRPIWEEIRDAGKSIGVFGSNYSQNWYHDKDENVKFYLPDKFATNNAASPKRTIAYQRIIRLFSKMADQGQDFKLNRWKIRLSVLHFLASRLMRLRIGPVKTLFRSDGSSIRFKPRSLIGARLAFYEFMSVYKISKPDFSTFAIGSLATALHIDAIEYDKAKLLDHKERLAARKRTLVGRTLEEIDLVVTDLMKICEDNKTVLILASGYGQKPVQSKEKAHEMWTIGNVNKLFNSLNLKIEHKQLESMFPCTTIKFKSNTDRDCAVSTLKRVTQPDNTQMLFCIEEGERCCSIRPTPNNFAKKRKIVSFLNDKNKNVFLNANEIGVNITDKNVLTGRHQLGGVFMAYHAGSSYLNVLNESIKESSIARMILKIMDIEAPEYMTKLSMVSESIISAIQKFS